jgi:hypothetical protein
MVDWHDLIHNDEVPTEALSFQFPPAHCNRVVMFEKKRKGGATFPTCKRYMLAGIFTRNMQPRGSINLLLQTILIRTGCWTNNESALSSVCRYPL